MTEITIIGSGNMARALGLRAVAAGRSLQILDRAPEHAAKLAAELGSGTSSGGLGEIPEGDIVVLALYFGAAQEVATHFGDTLSGKTVVDISNPINMDTFDSLTVGPGTSAAEEIAALLPGADVVKAFNTTFAGPLAAGAAGGMPLDVFIASDSEDAANRVASFAAAGGLRPLRVGGLRHSRELEGFQLLVMALQTNSAYESFNWDTGLKILD
ncbi:MULTISPECIES: NADPH-dependent F420 reductase [unclassified Arthrobacter]|uniref:NADPH-dependent F420 reductase n=1 Tax=unclassified Arthrobacter TaxID=235627 RepID=UPI002E010056|nr:MULTISPECIES: NAD(P)-binding domain-containing protein [unclassified Arthrobacter]MEC5192795.1 putative dinucleotide-binding enzyme [Arthrobacter sp. MP_M4]MEC5204320.1 putative dinucleotide-binding enzyme [Arthrobacter sp. MP_M7]